MEEVWLPDAIILSDLSANESNSSVSFDPSAGVSIGDRFFMDNPMGEFKKF